MMDLNADNEIKAYLQERYQEDNKAYLRILIPVMFVLIAMFAAGLIMLLNQNPNGTEILLQLVCSSTATLGLYLIIRLKFKPKKPSEKDVIKWKVIMEKHENDRSSNGAWIKNI